MKEKLSKNIFFVLVLASFIIFLKALCLLIRLVCFICKPFINQNDKNTNSHDTEFFDRIDIARTSFYSESGESNFSFERSIE